MMNLPRAVQRDNPIRVQALLDAGADPNARDNHGFTPLYWAVWHSSLAVIPMLLKGGADLHARHGSRDGTLLHWAGSPAVVKILLDAGADLHARDKNGETPLHVAAGSGDPARVKVLLDAGADLHARAEDGKTPLHVAEQYGGERYDDPGAIPTLLEVIS